jgi:hypothetical protein
LAGTLKAAKRRKVITYDSELLLQGAHDDIDIVLLQVCSGVFIRLAYSDLDLAL